MPIKTILVALTGDTPTPHVVDAAFQLAGPFNSHIIGTDTAVIPLRFGTDLGVGMTGSYHDELFKVTEKITTHMHETAQADFESIREKHLAKITERPSSESEITCFWVPHTRQIDDPIIMLGRTVDLIVVEQPGSITSFNATQALETALFQTGRSILMVPRPDIPFQPMSAIIAWNGSQNASRAVTAALPLLASMECVSIVQINDTPDGNPGADYVSDYLGWHDIKAIIHHIDNGDHDDGSELLEAASNLKSDMIIMGAYARSPVREIVFGGMTRHVVYHSNLPVLFAH